jgi:hypothetical protein
MSILEKILGDLKLQRTSTALTVVQPQLSGRWTRVVTDNDIVLGFNHRCVCGETKKYLHTEAATDKVHTCQCGRSFNCKQSLLLTGADTQIVKRAEPQRLIRTVGEDATPIFWSGKINSARERAFDAGDPGYTNMFGEPRH